MKHVFFVCLLGGLLVDCIQDVNHQASQKLESKSAFAVYDNNSEEFKIVTHEPPRDKYVAGARYVNSINQTG